MCRQGNALVCDLRQRVQQVARRARQPVEARHQERVALAKGGNRAPKLGAVALRTAGRLPKNLFGSGGAQSLHLRVNALAVRRDSCIAENHARTVPERENFCNNLLHGGKP